MSVITAIFQALLQAICWILPISETAHSSMFHDFANRFSGACSALTGVVHIGIALGIVISLNRLFISLTKEFFMTGKELVKRQLKIEKATPTRAFMYKTLLSFVPMLFWLIPCGKDMLLFSALRKTQFNSTLLDDGVFLALTGLMVVLASHQLSLKINNKNVSELGAIVVGCLSVFLVPVSGLSLIAGAFCVLMLFGVSKKLAFRYGFVLSVPVLVVMGIVEICISVTKIGVVPIILALIISVLSSFVLVRLFKLIVEKELLKYFGIYDITAGLIVAVVGIFELILR